LRPLTKRLDHPVYVTDAKDVTGRLYVVLQCGQIRILENGELRPEPFLEISDRIARDWQRGLLSAAFAPDYAVSGTFYVLFIDATSMIIERYRRATGGELADPSPVDRVLEIPLEGGVHNAGHLAFGPDGYLYVGTGSSGSGDDPKGNGQRTDTLLAKLLRIDVSGPSGYAIPPDNPFVGTNGAQGEIWALGLGSPWRFSFDRQTGDLWIGDVGADRAEEIDFQPASSGGGENYGWVVMEGDECLADVCDTGDFVAPVATYNHDAGDCAVIGGYVYRGSAMPELRGTYVYGDNCSGRIWGIDAAEALSGRAKPRLLLDTMPSPDGAIFGPSSFGEDNTGELYVADLVSDVVYQLVSH
jgi:glucose/arabinose dehydrogenase